MSRARQSSLCVAVLLAVTSGLAQPALPGQTDISPVHATRQAAADHSTTVAKPSPVVFFRQLLSMTPRERMHSLTNRPPEARARILAKVNEYLLLPPEERELRLRATELRWYLTPMFRMAPADRPAQLAEMPQGMRDLVQSRLAQWDVLPPPLQQEFLANDRALPYFAHVELATGATNSQPQIAAQFEQFFELTADEKAKALNALSDNERDQMEKTLKSFDALPPEQRQLCVRNYARFAGMTEAERADFLKNAARWSQMSPQERQTWHDLVAQVPIWPPTAAMNDTSASIMPPMPGNSARPNMATN